MLAGGVVFLDRGSANQFFVAIFVALVFLVVDTFVRPYHDFRCNALKVLTSMSMLITLLCGFASKLDWRNEVVSDDTLGWTLIVSSRTRIHMAT
jgi:predicted small integral membrane protein